MRLLLDTHTFLWWVADDPRLKARARSAIAKASEVYVSVASCWEMAIKISLNKLTLTSPVERFVAEHLAASQFALLPLELDEVGRVARLPFHHRDPFDRVLAAQALDEGLVVVSADPVFERYGVKRVW